MNQVSLSLSMLDNDTATPPMEKSININKYNIFAVVY